VETGAAASVEARGGDDHIAIAQASLASVDAERWDELAGDSGFYLSYDWLRFVEGDPGTSVEYLLGRRGHVVVGALPLYDVREEANSRYQPQRFTDLFRQRGRLLVAGARTAYRSTLLVDWTLPPDIRQTIVELLLRRALERAQDCGFHGVVMPFLTTEALIPLIRGRRVVATLDAVEAQIEDYGGSFAQYTERLSPSRRHRVRRERRIFTESGWSTTTQQLGDCAPTLARLLLNVNRKYGHSASLQVLREFLERQAEFVGWRSVVFSCEDKHGIAGAALYYSFRNTMYGRLVGFDYGRLRNAFEYFNLAYYEPIVALAPQGPCALHLGIGSWEAKARRGATIRPLWTAFVPLDTDTTGGGLELLRPEAVEEWLATLRSGRYRFDAAEWSPGSWMT
jgi:predicted N-acyltransferase